MLNGIDPILIIQLRKPMPEVSDALKEIPFVSAIPTFIDQPPIPIYLSKEITGIYLDSQSKSVEISTDVESLSNHAAGISEDALDSAVIEEQKQIQSNTTINLIAVRGTIGGLGVSILSALIDNLFEKINKDDYWITYMNGATTILRAKLESFAVDENSSDTRISMSLTLGRGAKQPEPKKGISEVEDVGAIIPNPELMPSA